MRIMLRGSNKMPLLVETLRVFNAYIRADNKSPEALKEHMKSYDKELEQLRVNFYSTAIDIYNPKVYKKVQDILESLNIPQNQWSQYLNANLTVYDFFIKLKTEGSHYQVDYILSLIEEKTSLATAKFVLGCLVAGLFSAGSAYLPAMAGILGMISTSGFAVSGLYESSNDPKKADHIRLRDNTFLLVNTFYNLSAYAIWAAREMSPTVGSLFVAASIVNVIKDLFCMAQYWIEHEALPPIYDSNNLNIHQTYARREYQYLQNKNAAAIDVSVSLALAGVMAAWCFLPGGLFLTVTAVVTNISLAAIKYYLHKENEATIRVQLQEELDHIKTLYPSINVQTRASSEGAATERAKTDENGAKILLRDEKGAEKPKAYNRYSFYPTLETIGISDTPPSQLQEILIF